MHLPLVDAGLDAAALRLLLRATERLAAFAGGVHAYPRHAMDVLRELLDADAISYAERNIAAGTLATRWSEPAADYPAIVRRVAQLCADDPAFLGRPDGSVQRLSDAYPLARLRGMALYHEAMRPLHVSRNLNFGFAVGGAIVVQFGVCREGAPDFGEVERRLADAARPWLARAYAAAVTRSWSALRPDALAHASPLDLTPRQREILRWTLSGKSNALIGQIVGRSAETVKNHLRVIYRRLGVYSRIEAALKIARTAPPYIPSRDLDLIVWRQDLGGQAPEPAGAGPTSRPPGRGSRSPPRRPSSPP